MTFNNIDAPGNRRNRRAVAAIQRGAGAEGRKAAAQAKRQRKMARSFERDLGKTVVFYKMPLDGVNTHDPDGVYLNQISKNGRRQMVVAGPFKASLDHYVKAIGLFLKTPMRLVECEELPLLEGAVSERCFASIIVEPVNEA